MLLLCPSALGSPSAQESWGSSSSPELSPDKAEGLGSSEEDSAPAPGVQCAAEHPETELEPSALMGLTWLKQNYSDDNTLLTLFTI